MAKTLAEKRRALNELGAKGLEPNREEILRLAFLLYDPMCLPLLSAQEQFSAAANRVGGGADAVQSKFWSKCMELIPAYNNERKQEMIQAALMRVLEQELPKYESGKGSLTGFLEYHIRNQVVNLVREDFGRSPGKKALEAMPPEERAQEEEKQEQKKRLRRHVSLSTPIGEDSDDEELTLADTLSAPDSSLEEAERRVDRTEAKGLEFVANVLLLARDRDKTDSLRLTPKKLRSFRVVYSAGVINIEHDGEPEPEFRYRRRVEEALEALFLDHCLVVPDCRTLTAVRRSPIKPEHFKPFPKKRDERCLIGAVRDSAGAGYLGVSKGTYSGISTQYENLMRSALCREGILNESGR